MLRISNYATASTNTAAYIIGGFGSKPVSTIAEFPNGQWRDTGNLNEPKSSLSSIFYGGQYMVVGGYESSGR